MKFLAILIILVGLNCFALSFSSSQQLKKTAGSSAKKAKNHSGQNTICGCCAGKNGLNGRDGRDGLSGRDGIKGDMGGQGERGYNGTCNEGDKGKKGAQGIQGVKGAQGEQGYNGTCDKGDMGGQGERGYNGTCNEGDKGKKGAQGIQGVKGAQGEQGYNGTCDKSALNIAVEKLEKEIRNLTLKIQALENATDCLVTRALGMHSGAITDSQLSASSVFSNDKQSYGAGRGRINRGTWRGWAAKILDTNQYLQIDFQRKTKVTAVATQGYNPSYDIEWVRTYQISYSRDKTNWSLYTENNAIKTFQGNTDSTTVEKRTFKQPIQYTLLMRFLPKTWKKHISMRVEVYGCYEH